MDKEKYLEFTIDGNGIMSTDNTDDDRQDSLEQCRVINQKTYEVIEYPIDGDYSGMLRSFGSWFPDDGEIRMIRWVSAKALNSKVRMRIKCLLALGYVTAPELYPTEIAAKYDEYIRRNLTRMLPRVPYLIDYDTYAMLIKHAFAIGKPSKAAIKAALSDTKLIVDFDSLQDSSLYKMLIEHFMRFYPKMAREYLAKEAVRTEAITRMKLLKLSEEAIEAFYHSGTLMLSDQTTPGRDPEAYEDSDGFTIKREYSYFKDDIHKGVVWSLAVDYPTEEQLQIVKEVENKFNLLVYHIHCCQINEEMVLNALLVVGRNEDEWEHERMMTDMGLPDCVAPVFGYESFEYISLPVKAVCGCLLRTS